MKNKLFYVLLFLIIYGLTANPNVGSVEIIDLDREFRIQEFEKSFIRDFEYKEDFDKPMKYIPHTDEKVIYEQLKIINSSKKTKWFSNRF